MVFSRDALFLYFHDSDISMAGSRLHAPPATPQRTMNHTVQDTAVLFLPKLIDHLLPSIIRDVPLINITG